MKKLFKIGLMFFVAVLALTVLLASCNSESSNTVTTEDSANEATTENNDSGDTTEIDETTEGSDTTNTEENTTEQTSSEPDVMIGETLDAEYASDFTVSKAFSNNMVIQRGERIRVWGWADETENGKKVSATFKGMFAEAIIENGEWCITFTARLEASADLGNTFKVYTDTKSVEFTDVLVGDVFYVVGQSNVAYSVSDHLGFFRNDADKGGSTVIEQYSDAPIRIFYNSLNQSSVDNGYPQKGTDTVVKDVISDSKWEIADTRNIRKFSALGYYTALQIIMQTDEKIPVGMIEFDGNGLPLGSFMPNEVAESTNIDSWDETAGKYICSGMNNNHGSRFIYNHFMAAFEKYAVAGIIWYQGESNCNETFGSDTFADDFTALMTYLRSVKNVTNMCFPVFIVEFPSIYEQPSGYNGTWHFIDLGRIRGIVGSIPLILENSYVSVSSDLWSDDTFYNNLHPNCKYEQGGRLAKLILAVCNGSMNFEEATGPVVESITYSSDGKNAVVKFKNVGDGLKTSDGGTEVLGFRVFIKAGNKVIETKANAVISSNDTVTVSGLTSKSIVGIAYNTVADNYYGRDINLCNSFSMPASAFLVFKD